MGDFQRQSEDELDRHCAVARSLIAVSVARCTKPLRVILRLADRSMKHHGVRDVVCRAFGADGPYWGSILGLAECELWAFARASHA